MTEALWDGKNLLVGQTPTVGDGSEESDSSGAKEPAHLVVDVKHSLLDLLVDLLGCVDERL